MKNIIKQILLISIFSVLLTGCGDVKLKSLPLDADIISYADIVENWDTYKDTRVSIVLKASYVYEESSGENRTQKVSSEKYNGKSFLVYFENEYIISKNEFIIITGDVDGENSGEIKNAILNYTGEIAEKEYNEQLEAYENLKQSLKEETAEEERIRQEKADAILWDSIDSVTKEEYVGECKSYYYSLLEEQQIGEKVMIEVVAVDGGKYVDASLVSPTGGFQHFYTCYEFSPKYIKESNTDITDSISIEPVYRVYGFLGDKSEIHGGSGHRDLLIYPVYMDYIGDLADYQNGKLDDGYVEDERTSYLDIPKSEFMEMCTPIENGVQISSCDDELECYEVVLAKKQKLTHDDAGVKLAKIDDSDFTYSQTVWKAYSEGSYRGRKMSSYLTLYFANEGNACPNEYYVGQKIYVYTVNYSSRHVVVYVK